MGVPKCGAREDVCIVVVALSTHPPPGSVMLDIPILVVCSVLS